MKKAQGKYLIVIGLVGIAIYSLLDGREENTEWEDMIEPLPFDNLSPLQEVDADSAIRWSLYASQTRSSTKTHKV